MILYDNAFSPFARKVRLVLDAKGLDYEVVDGLTRKNREALEAVNGRVEVPTNPARASSTRRTTA